jgi:hypothetical protein
MKCPSCGAGIADNSSVCEYCQQSITLPAQPTPAPSGGPRLPAARPAKFQIEDDLRTLTISWRWLHPRVFFLLPFAIAWNAFLVGWYSMAGGGMASMPFGFRLIFLIFPIGHVAVGLGLIYAVATMLLNRTWVRLADEQLTVEHGPLPWPGMTIPIAEISQLFVKFGGPRRADGVPTSIAYSLEAQLKDGSTRTLLKYVQDVEEARYLEQTLEKRLNIEDARVSGEAL